MTLLFRALLRNAQIARGLAFAASHTPGVKLTMKPTMHRTKTWVLVFCAAAALTATGVSAQEQGGGDLRAKVQNPVGSLISVPFKNTFDFGAPNGTAYSMNLQPVIPVTVGDWNLINRAIIPVIRVPGPVGGLPNLPNADLEQEGSTWGLGDINYSVFLSPAAPGKWIWGVGPSVTLKTATQDATGSGKWSAGPTAVVLTQPKPWTLGVLGRQLWSFAGDSDRNSVNQFLLEPFVNYNLDKGWYLITDMVMTANWDEDSDNRWTIPVGGGVGKLFKVGNQAMNTRVEVYYNVERPDFAPDWSVSWTLQFLFPK